MIEDQTQQEPVNEPIHIINETPRRNWSAWIAAGGCAVLICSTIFLVTILYFGPQAIQKLFPVLSAENQLREITQNNTMGDPNAPIHIIEYGDFQCPYCLRFWSETEPQLIEEYVNTGKVYFEFRAFPILGDESFLAAEAAYCAGDQNQFWEYHDILFTNWTGENVGDFTQEKLIQYAEVLGLNVVEFESCLVEEKYKSKVEQDKAEGEAAGVYATPTFFINGHIVEGAQPFEVFKHVIEELLNGNLNTVNG